jgi:hypothetical protein
LRRVASIVGPIGGLGTENPSFDGVLISALTEEATKPELLRKID